MILFSSVTEINSKKSLKTALIYLLITIFCALFGAVYELYSHEVYSFFMIYAFAFPLVCGALPFAVLALLRTRKHPCSLARNLLHSGIGTLTVGSIVRGVLEIYGTTNQLSDYYWPVGAILYSLGIVVCILQFVFRIGENGIT